MDASAVFSERVRDLRAKKGVSQQKVADEVGVTKVGYQYYEYGRKLPGFKTLSKLADFFEVSTDYLLGRSNEPQLPDKETMAMVRQLQAFRNGDKQAENQ